MNEVHKLFKFALSICLEKVNLEIIFDYLITDRFDGQ